MTTSAHAAASSTDLTARHSAAAEPASSGDATPATVVDAPPDWEGWDDDVSRQDRPEQGVARILWVGTGEGNGRNSSSWGHGVYRSTDGGASFQHLGLQNTHDIQRPTGVCAATGRELEPGETVYAALVDPPAEDRSEELDVFAPPRGAYRKPGTGFGVA